MAVLMNCAQGASGEIKQGVSREGANLDWLPLSGGARGVERLQPREELCGRLVGPHPRRERRPEVLASVDRGCVGCSFSANKAIHTIGVGPRRFEQQHSEHTVWLCVPGLNVVCVVVGGGGDGLCE
jgi:hypothetical protein